MTTTSFTRPLPRPAAPPPMLDTDARDLVGRFAVSRSARDRRRREPDADEGGVRTLVRAGFDFTLGTAVVLWHLALAGRDRRRRTTTGRRWSSTR